MSSASGGTKWKCKHCLVEIPGVALVPKFCFQCGKEQAETTTPLMCGDPECSNQVSSLGNKYCDPCSIKNPEIVKHPIQESTTESLPKDPQVEEEEDAIKKARHIQDGGQYDTSPGEEGSKQKPIVIKEEPTADYKLKDVSHGPDSQISYNTQVFGELVPVVGIHQEQMKLSDSSQVSSLCKSDSEKDNVTRSQEDHPASAELSRRGLGRKRSGSDSMPSSASKRLHQNNEHTSQGDVQNSNIIVGRDESGDQANSGSGKGERGGSQAKGGSGSGDQANGGGGGQASGSGQTRHEQSNIGDSPVSERS